MERLFYVEEISHHTLFSHLRSFQTLFQCKTHLSTSGQVTKWELYMALLVTTVFPRRHLEQSRCEVGLSHRSTRCTLSSVGVLAGLYTVCHVSLFPTALPRLGPSEKPVCHPHPLPHSNSSRHVRSSIILFEGSGPTLYKILSSWKILVRKLLYTHTHTHKQRHEKREREKDTHTLFFSHTHTHIWKDSWE